MPTFTLSLVTPCLNAAPFIAEAIESSLANGVASFEHIIADGRSSDGTLERLASYPHLTIDSRPDAGIYDALNRALGRATGEIIGILNADDMLEPGWFADVVATFADDPELEMLSGAAGIFREAGTDPLDGGVLAPGGPPTPAGLAFGVPCLNARFFRRRVIERIGPFDQSFPLAGDRDWLIRATLAGLRTAWTDRVLYRYRSHAGSATLAGRRASGRRIWADHLRLAEALIERTDTPPALRHIALAWRALEGTKLTLAGPPPAIAPGRMSFFARLFENDHQLPLHLARGLRLWRRHRGRHSDL